MGINSNYNQQMSNLANILRNMYNGQSNKDIKQDINFDIEDLISKNVKIGEDNKNAEINFDLINNNSKAKNDGKLNLAERLFFFDINGDGKLDERDQALLANNNIKINKKGTRIIIDKDGNIKLHQNGILMKTIYANGKYRIYNIKEDGTFNSSYTYNSDGTLYSYEEYQDSYFSDGNKQYSTRRIYSEKGDKKDENGTYYEQKFEYKKNSDGTITKIQTSSKTPNQETIETLDRDKNKLSKKIATINDKKQIIKEEIKDLQTGKTTQIINYEYNKKGNVSKKEIQETENNTKKIYEYKYNEKGKLSKTILTKYIENGDILEYENDKLIKRTYASNGNYRIYERNTDGTLISSKTYRKTGVIYSEEKYIDDIFGSASKIVSEKTFYDKNGKYSYTENYNYQVSQGNIGINNIGINTLEASIYILNTSAKYKTETKFTNNKIIKTITSTKYPNQETIITMDKNKNIEAKSVIQKDDNGNILEITSYENDDNKPKTTIKLITNDQGKQVYQREYYNYNEDGSYYILRTQHSTKIEFDENGKELIKGNNGLESSERLDYDKDGKLLSKTVYNYKTNQPTNLDPFTYDHAKKTADNNIDILTSKIIYEYENGNEENIKSIKKEKYNYEYALDKNGRTKKDKNGNKIIDVSKGKTVLEYEVKRNDNGEFIKNDDGSYKFSKVLDENGNQKTIEEKTTLNTKGITADELLDKVREYLGYSNIDNNRYLFGTQNNWCSTFATYMLMELGIDLGDIVSRFSTKSIYSLAVTENRHTDNKTLLEKTKDYEPGSEIEWLKGQVAFCLNREPGTQHTGGFVEKAVRNSDGSITVTLLEGNGPETVKRSEYIIKPDGYVVDKNGKGYGLSGFADFLS